MSNSSFALAFAKQQIRRQKAEALVDSLLASLQSTKAREVYQLPNDDVATKAFALGYLTSVVARLASESPSALKVLQGMVEHNADRLEA